MTRSHPRRFDDDGAILTVDLHGCGVDDALYIIRRSLQEAYRRGRQKVDVIHGSSTSGGGGHGRTIKNAFERHLKTGEYADWVSGSTQDVSGGRTSLWMSLGPRANPARIAVSDVVPRGR